MSEPERTYTLDEAEQELARQSAVEECERNVHQPVVFSYDLSGFCACGQYRWKGEKV